MKEVRTWGVEVSLGRELLPRPHIGLHPPRTQPRGS